MLTFKGIGMYERAIAVLAMPALACAMPGHASSYAYSVSIRAQSMDAALRDLARQTGIELLFDRDLVRGLQSRGAQGRMTIDAALRRVLDGSGLTVRRAASGAWVIERAGADASAPVEAEGPEILVVGRQTQNADIRRRENDVQPYQVATGEQIVRAHRDNLDQYFRSRVTANTVVLPPSLQEFGDTNSEIDLRGLGPEGTLVLVDGRRMPSIPTSYFGFGQSDINAIPLHAIERVETLTGTAGGIYGFGALGGVVNVVLRRDYRGFDLHGTAGISSRGDSRRLTLEGRFGFTPDGGRTDVMVNLSRTWSQPLLMGQRNYAVRGRTLNIKYARDEYLVFPQVSNSVMVSDLLGGTLVFKPEYGGADLGARYSYLPTGFGGTVADLVAPLTGNAGKLDVSLPEGQAKSYIGSNPTTTTSVIVSVRHRFGGDVEGYFDALILRNHGRNVDRGSDGISNTAYMFPDDPRNPFDNYLELTFPVPLENGGRRTDNDSERFTTGLIVPLPMGWKATAEAVFGAAHVASDGGNLFFFHSPLFLDETADPDFNPLGDWERFQRATETSDYRLGSRQYTTIYNRYREQSLRLTGPAFRTPAGAATLTLLAERREEKVPPYLSTFYRFIDEPETFEDQIPVRSSIGRSLYAELRAPLFGDAAPFPLLRGLELQLAARYEHLGADFSRSPDSPELPGGQDRLHAGFTGTAYTAGAKLSPLPWLMLRGSYATGRQPPPLDQLISTEEPAFLSIEDPKRGGTDALEEGDVLYKWRGNPELGTVKASTLSLGMVLNPSGDGGPRFSLDYSRVRRTGDPFAPFDDVVIAHEDIWPERVTRAPMTDGDRALGYTGGRIIALDTRAANGGGVSVKTIDGRFDWTIPFLTGNLRLNAAATVQLHNRQLVPFEPVKERAGYLLGPLRWRANGGGEWTAGATMIGVNLQYFNRYRINDTPDQGCGCASGTTAQGSEWVKSQMYLDLYASRRFRIRGLDGEHEVSLDLGIVNVLDKAPPYEAQTVLFTGIQTSLYGDPRGRRFELGLSTSF
jgi:iron complex outermembrane receptor protein